MDSESWERRSVVGIIPARGGSKAIPRKNVVDFCGKPLIAWTIEHALQSRSVTELYVSTDDDEIAEVATRCGALVIHRPDELATDVATSESAVRHALDLLEAQPERERPIDLAILYQATSPLRLEHDTDNAVAQFYLEGADSLFSAARAEDSTIWQGQPGELRSVTFDYRNRGMRQDREPCFIENGSFYLFTPGVLRRFDNRIGERLAVYLMPLWQSYEIDTAEELELCAWYMRRRILALRRWTVAAEALQLIVYDFDGVLTDNKVILNQDGVESVMANRADGLAIAALKRAGIPQLILSTETNPVVRARAAKMQIPVLNAVEDKRATLLAYCAERGMDAARVIFIGNDRNDREALEAVGYPLCPADAAEEIRAMARCVLDCRGGQGVARELWDRVVFPPAG